MADKKEGTVKWFNEKKGMDLFPVQAKMICPYTIAI